jgi:predicted short-subunit dehydrogenase-like oxidoreductase (DUF2520 family)
VKQFKISFAGAGNVTGALCRELHKKKHLIEHIVSRKEYSGSALAKLCEATWSDDFVFPESSEIIIVAVPDHSLSDVLGKIKCNDAAVVVHTAGSIGLDIFPSRLKYNGVLYPLQTFSPERKPDIFSVPFFIEASDDITLNTIRTLAESLTKSVYLSDSEHRRLLHLSAVFISNFTNHMLTAGKDISEKAGFSFEVLRPLILETLSKAIEKGPENSQTGPAMRHDLNTVERHLDLLSFSPELKNIYEVISRSIINYYNKNQRDDKL